LRSLGRRPRDFGDDRASNSSLPLVVGGSAADLAKDVVLMISLRQPDAAGREGSRSCARLVGTYGVNIKGTCRSGSPCSAVSPWQNDRKGSEISRIAACSNIRLQQNEESWSRPGAREDKMPVSPIPCCRGREGAPVRCAGALTCVPSIIDRSGDLADVTIPYRLSTSTFLWAASATVGTSSSVGNRVCDAIATHPVCRARPRASFVSG
jgi:hypothetical protein